MLSSLKAIRDLQVLGDAVVWEALQALAVDGGPPLSPLHLTLFALRSGGPRLASPLRKSLRKETDVEALESVLLAAAAREDGGDGVKWGLSRSSQAAVHRYRQVLEQGDPRAGVAAPEILLGCILELVGEAEREAVGRFIDLPGALQSLRRQAGAAIEAGGDPTTAQAASRSARSEGGARSATSRSAEGEEEAAEPFQLPRELIASDDLTERLSGANPEEPFPFDLHPPFKRVFEGLARALHRRARPHAVLVGERGVGLMPLVVEAARRAAQGGMKFLEGSRWLALHARYVLPEESRARLGAILSAAADRPDVVLAIDGFASLLKSVQPGGNRNVLLAGLAGARCRIVGLLAPREYEEHIAGDVEMEECFPKIEVPEPDLEAALHLLPHYARGLEREYKVTIAPEAVRQAAVLSHNYILNAPLPGKAVQLLRQVCEELDYRRDMDGASQRTATVEGVVEAVSAATGVPVSTLQGVADRSDYERSLGDFVVGQEHAVRTVARELGLIKAGMTEPGKPAGVMLFVGQTGTGKTETAKALARFYSTSRRLKTYTLGNFVEPHSVAGIIGVPPGYVGADQGGRLINELNADPYGVFLLDEVDKAHPDVLQPFLNLFDEGWIVDQRGTKAFGTRSIFILTTNVGQRMIADMASQGKSIEEMTERMKETLCQIRHGKSNRPVFTPEFLARIKRIVVFQPLSETAMDGICRKHLQAMERHWRSDRGKRLAIDPALPKLVAELAHKKNDKSQGKEGGRIVRKLIAEWIESPLQRAAACDVQGYRDAAELAVSLPGGIEGEPRPEQVEVRFVKDVAANKF